MVALSSVLKYLPRKWYIYKSFKQNRQALSELQISEIFLKIFYKYFIAKIFCGEPCIDLNFSFWENIREYFVYCLRIHRLFQSIFLSYREKIFKMFSWYLKKYSMRYRLPSPDLEILNLTELFPSIFMFIKFCHIIKDLKVSY